MMKRSGGYPITNNIIGHYESLQGIAPYRFAMTVVSEKFIGKPVDIFALIC